MDTDDGGDLLVQDCHEQRRINGFPIFVILHACVPMKVCIHEGVPCGFSKCGAEEGCNPESPLSVFDAIRLVKEDLLLMLLKLQLY